MLQWLLLALVAVASAPAAVQSNKHLLTWEVDGSWKNLPLESGKQTDSHPIFFFMIALGQALLIEDSYIV